ncbi:MotA/TolQ/ExbB proton channel family protein [Flavobacteriales bacterium]|jgi:biopolymer transport protein ExbB|nr:MotA/TolQ/ExbB proton channel family protein [Flavobacteriales bacterium]
MKLMFITTAMAQETMVQEEVGEEQTLSIIDLMTSGGIGGQIIMLVLLLLSIVAIYIFVERFLTISKAGIEDPAFFNGLKDSIQKSDLATAKALCSTTNTAISRMLGKGIARIGRPLGDISAAVENVGKLETYKLEKNLATLATISGAAPMIGFLGTVIGMILAFHEMAMAGGAVDVSMLAGGIYTAMTTTVAGLVVGIMAYLGYNILVAKVEAVVFKMEDRSTEFIDLLHEPA